MANPQFIDIDPYGIIATHPPRATLPVVAAPVPDDQKTTNFNTFRPHLVAIGCMRLPNKGFAFDSSLISSNAESAFVRFAKMMQALREQDEADPKRFPPCTIFGHADPTGPDPDTKDDYNKTLSGRRALAVYAVLTRNIGIWEELFQTPAGGDQWGVQAIQQMLSTPLKSPPKDDFEPAYYTGPIDGAKTKETKQATDDAVAAYKMARGLSDINEVRKTLFKEYMDALCHDTNGNPFVLDPTADFLAGGKGKGLKGDVQGCSEFNPIFLLSKQMEADSTMSADMRQSRNDLYLPDRRVVVFVFRQGTVIDPAGWPCPAAREGAAGCRDRFWSDGDKRRGETDKIRKFGENMSLIAIDDSNNVTTTPVEQTGNTMACRFYHAFAYNSPCEAQSKEWVVRFTQGSWTNSATKKGWPLKNCRYVVKAGESDNAAVIRGSTDDNGVVHIPVFDDKAKMTIRLDVSRVHGPAPQPPPGGDKNQPDESKYLPLTLDGGALHAPDLTDPLAIAQRLYNMAFGEGDPAKWTDDDVATALGRFQKMFFASQTPSSPDDVKKAVITNHDIAGVAPPASPDGTGSP